MDTTPKYIKMCEKAEEIQKGWKPKAGDFYAWAGHTVRKEGTVIIGVVKYYDPSTNLIHGMQTMAERRHRLDVICLFRQDQLQEMVGIESRYQLLHKFDMFYHNLYIDFVSVDASFTSMEQLWLAFVMKEKFNKIWDDKKEEWIS